MVYRLNSIKAELDGDTIQYEMEKVYGWLLIYLNIIGITQLHIIPKMLSKLVKWLKNIISLGKK